MYQQLLPFINKNLEFNRFDIYYITHYNLPDSRFFVINYSIYAWGDEFKETKSFHFYPSKEIRYSKDYLALLEIVSDQPKFIEGEFSNTYKVEK